MGSVIILWVIHHAETWWHFGSVACTVAPLRVSHSASRKTLCDSMEFHGDPGMSGPLSSDQTSWDSWTCILSFLAHSSALFVFSTGKGTHSLAPAKHVLYCWALPPASGTFFRSADPRPSLDKGVDQETLPSTGWGGGGDGGGGCNEKQHEDSQWSKKNSQLRKRELYKRAAHTQGGGGRVNLIGLNSP